MRYEVRQATRSHCRYAIVPVVLVVPAVGVRLYAPFGHRRYTLLNSYGVPGCAGWRLPRAAAAAPSTSFRGQRPCTGLSIFSYFVAVHAPRGSDDGCASSALLQQVLTCEDRYVVNGACLGALQGQVKDLAALSARGAASRRCYSQDDALGYIICAFSAAACRTSYLLLHSSFSFFRAEAGFRFLCRCRPPGVYRRFLSAGNASGSPAVNNVSPLRGCAGC